MPDFTCLDRIRARRPLIHCVSNIVSANDCANLVLAAGAGPIMAHAPEEAADITAASAAVVLNTGTPDEARFRTCLLCGKEAARLGRPVVLDPVGVGASPWRLERVGALLESFPVSILRVNLGGAGRRRPGAGEAVPGRGAAHRAGGPCRRRGERPTGLRREPADDVCYRDGMYAVGPVRRVRRRGASAHGRGPAGLRLLEDLRPPGGGAGRGTGSRQLPHGPAGRRRDPDRRRPGRGGGN